MVVTTPRPGWLALLLLAGLVSPAAGQVTQSAPGSVRGLLGSGSGTAGAPALTLAVDVDGGYDGNSLPDGGGAPSAEFAPIQSGYAGTAQSGLRFQMGRQNRYVLGTATGSVSQEQIAAGLRSFRLYRGTGSFQAGTNLGRRSGLTMGVGRSYEPTYLFGAFSALDRNAPGGSPVEVAPTPSVEPTASITQQRWVSTTANAGLFHNWTPRQRIGARYETFRMRPITGTGFESNRNSGALSYLWNRTEWVRLDFNYQYDDNPQVFGDIERPLTTQSAEARVRYEHRIAPGRSAAVMAGGGAVQVRVGSLNTDDGFKLVTPTASGSFTFDLSRTWRLGLTARRDVTVLNGLSPQTFKSNVGQVSLDGTVARRLNFGISGGASRGTAMHAAAGRFTQSTLDARLRYGFGSYAGMLVRYSYNDHEFRNVELIPDAFPTRYNRNSVRVGLTFWLPLFGTF